ncbi:MAG: SGNH/GDSL hydrolase family protein [Verrucomicrobiota bacterium]
MIRGCLCLLAVSIASLSADDHAPIRPGDHIAIIGNTFADQLRTHGYLETLLLQHNRENPFSIRNLGWGGDRLNSRDRPTGFPTEEETLTAHRADVIIACFGMGESFAGDNGIDEFKRQLQSLIDSHTGKSYNGNSEVRLILVSPIAYEDLGKLTPAREKRNRELKAYTQAMRDVAAAAKVPFVDLFEVSLSLMDEATGPKLTNNGIHLNPYGYWAISHAFFDQLTASDRESKNPSSWRIRVDAGTLTTDGSGVEVLEVARHESGLSFLVSEVQRHSSDHAC